MGHEALSEILISALLKKSNVPEYVEYLPAVIEYDGKLLNGCVSNHFRKKDEMLVPLERLHRAYQGRGLAQTLSEMPEPADRIRYTVEFVEHATGLSGFGRWLTLLLELDAFFLNEDRHTNNIAVIRNEASGQFRLCPVFDNGLALLSDETDYAAAKDIYACIRSVQAKPFSRDFDEQVSCANALYGSFLKFSFTKEDAAKALNALAGFYPDDILKRTGSVLYEQMRKYPVCF